MNRIPFPRLFFFLALAVAGGSTPFARAEIIRSFDVDVRLQKDTTLDITETIAMDFEGASRRGIIRNIPTSYRRNNAPYSVYVKVLSVDNGNGGEWNYETSNSGGDLSIKIGDADVFLTGAQTYKIHYTVRRAVNFFDGNAPEVYWNATGDQWSFPIAQSSTRFYPPPGVAVSSIKSTSFQGPPGSTTPAKVEAKADHILFSAANLDPGSGMTIVAGLPAGSVVKPTATQNLLWIFADWWPAFLLPLVSVLFLGMTYFKSGRDIDGGQAVAVEWNPPTDLTPAQVGTLVDESCDMADIVSTLVDLAARGYLIIQENESEKFLFLSSKDYTFIKRPDAPSEAELLPYERKFLKGIFAASDQTSLSSLKNNFYTHLPGIREGIYKSLMQKNLFTSNPETTTGAYALNGIIAGAIGLFLWFIVSASWGIGLLLSGILCFFCAKAMPAKTAIGSKYLRQCLGFKRYVSLAEKDRIKVLADQDPTIFGRLLPYAMVLGVADQWADAFKDLMTQPPDWYVGSSYNQGFVPMVFVSDLGSGMNTMGNTFSSQPQAQSTGGSGGSGFSGGGFSGGGFGGGGGSSW